MVRLGAAHPTGPAGHPQIGKGPIEGFHLANAVVDLEGFSRTGLPKPAMEGFHAGRTHRRLGNVHIERKQLRKLLGIEVGLGGQITRIYPNHLDWLATRPAQLTDHVQQHGRLNAKTGGEGKPLPKGLLRPGEPFLRRQGLEQPSARRQINRRTGSIPGIGGGWGGHHSPIIARCPSPWLGFKSPHPTPTCVAG